MSYRHATVSTKSGDCSAHTRIVFLRALLEQDGKRRRAGRRQFERENLEQGVAIVDRPMSGWIKSIIQRSHCSLAEKEKELAIALRELAEAR